jgi:hypothetical protein
MYKTIILPVVIYWSNIDSYKKCWGDKIAKNGWITNFEDRLRLKSQGQKTRGTSRKEMDIMNSKQTKSLILERKMMMMMFYMGVELGLTY